MCVQPPRVRPMSKNGMQEGKTRGKDSYEIVGKRTRVPGSIYMCSYRVKCIYVRLVSILVWMRGFMHVGSNLLDFNKNLSEPSALFRAPQHKVGESTWRGTWIDVVHVLVFLYWFPIGLTDAVRGMIISWDRWESGKNEEVGWGDERDMIYKVGLAMLIPIIEPLTRRNRLRLGQGYVIPNPYPNPHDPWPSHRGVTQTCDQP